MLVVTKKQNACRMQIGCTIPLKTVCFTRISFPLNNDRQYLHECMSCKIGEKKTQYKYPLKINK